MTGFLLVLIHALIIFMLFKPIIYCKFFDQHGTVTLLAGLSMLGGVLSFVVLWGYDLSLVFKPTSGKIRHSLDSSLPENFFFLPCY